MLTPPYGPLWAAVRDWFYVRAVNLMEGNTTTTMSWQNIDLKNISPDVAIIPTGTYTFELLPGAKYDERDTGRINFKVGIATDGEFKGRQMFGSYPDPESVSPRSGKRQDWSAVALKRLEVACGVDFTDQEDPVAYLNRIAGSRFQSSVSHSQPTDEYPTPKANLNLLNVKAAA